MTQRFESRLGRLEQQQALPWRAYIGRPFPEWPDDALDALLCYDEGLDSDIFLLTNAELQLLDTMGQVAPPE